MKDRGGVCGRGVLLDWVTYAEKYNISYNPVSRQEIPISDLEACAKEQGVQFQVGDILFVRSGFVKWHNNATDDERKAGTQAASNYIGVKPMKTPSSGTGTIILRLSSETQLRGKYGRLLAQCFTNICLLKVPESSAYIG